MVEAATSHEILDFETRFQKTREYLNDIYSSEFGRFVRKSSNPIETQTDVRDSNDLEVGLFPDALFKASPVYQERLTEDFKPGMPRRYAFEDLYIKGQEAGDPFHSTVVESVNYQVIFDDYATLYDHNISFDMENRTVSHTIREQLRDNGKPTGKYVTAEYNTWNMDVEDLNVLGLLFESLEREKDFYYEHQKPIMNICPNPIIPDNLPTI